MFQHSFDKIMDLTNQYPIDCEEIDLALKFYSNNLRYNITQFLRVFHYDLSVLLNAFVSPLINWS